MKKILKNYFRYQKDEDLKNLHFTDIETSIKRDDESSLSADRWLIEETFLLYLRELDLEKFIDILNKILHETKETYFFVDNAVSIAKKEDGYNITLTFVTRR